jgi:hypothetical protein
MKFKITGIEAQAKKNFLTFASLRPTGRVVLKPEPENAYDKFCVGVWYGDVLLGYIPAQKEDGVYVGSELQKHIISNAVGFATISAYSYIGKDGRWNTDHDGWLQSVELELPDAGGVEPPDDRYKRVTEFISHYSHEGKADNLIKWAFSQGDTFEKYATALQKTADDGTAMHEAIENFFRWPSMSPDSPFPEEMATKLPSGFRAFVDKYNPRMAYMEQRFYDDTLMVTGQPDFVGYVGDKLVVIDWKSSKSVSMKHKLQAAIYAKNAQHEGSRAVGAMVVCFGAKTKQGFSVCELDYSKINSIYEAMRHLKSAMDILKG